MFQTLTGDSSDGYSGIKGCGAVKAERVLYNSEKTLPSMWKAVVEEYKRNNLTEKDALLQARMARILRTQDYNFKTKKPILWRL
jgi:DNA polymerase-1